MTDIAFLPWPPLAAVDGHVQLVDGRYTEVERLEGVGLLVGRDGALSHWQRSRRRHWRRMYWLLVVSKAVEAQQLKPSAVLAGLADRWGLYEEVGGRRRRDIRAVRRAIEGPLAQRLLGDA